VEPVMLTVQPSEPRLALFRSKAENFAFGRFGLRESYCFTTLISSRVSLSPSQHLVRLFLAHFVRLKSRRVSSGSETSHILANINILFRFLLFDFQDAQGRWDTICKKRRLV
jgi:hypothetical protein